MQTRPPLSGLDAVTFAANAPTCAAIHWVAPVLAPHVPSADVQSLSPTPAPVPSDPLVLLLALQVALLQRTTPGRSSKVAMPPSFCSRTANASHSLTAIQLPSSRDSDGG